MAELPLSTPVYQLENADEKTTSVWYQGASEEELHFKVIKVYKRAPKVSKVVYVNGLLIHATMMAIKIHHEEY